MFTGIIQAIGAIGRIEKRGGDSRFEIALAELGEETIALGDSVAVNGVCLTAVEFDRAEKPTSMLADVSGETLACTTLGDLKQHDPVNLELALTPTTRLGGHMVSGHVDGVGGVVSRQADARSERLVFRTPTAIAKYIAAKGSICVDGVSLTVNEVSEDTFGVNIVPHTLLKTTLGRCQPGVRVNLEIDIIARYLERLLSAGWSSDSGESTDMLLARSGMLDPGRFQS